MDPGVDPRFLDLLRSPLTGDRLSFAAPSILEDGETSWPVVDGIPYLRTGRDELRHEVVQALQRQDREAALALLLTDRKDETIPPAEPAGVRRALTSGTARQVMVELRYGSLAEYFLHRTCHPSYLSGLGLLEAHAATDETMFEVACGVGHFLRAWHSAAGGAIGADTVFSHLWLARKFVAPCAYLVCFDVEGRFPLATGSASFAFANDAFHYFSGKGNALAEMRRISASGRVLLGHVHNADQPNFSPGQPLTIGEYCSMLRPRLAYDDAELTWTALSGRAGKPATAAVLRSAQAVAFVIGPEPVGEGPSLVVPPPGSELRVNPILTEDGPAWPNRRFEKEYAQSWEYLNAMKYPPNVVVEAAAEKGVGSDPRIERHCRMRTLLDLPENWL